MSEKIPVPEVKYTQLFINNEFVNSVSGKTFGTFNPCNGEKIADVQEGDKSVSDTKVLIECGGYKTYSQADIDKAVKAAQNAFALSSPWRQMDASNRGTLLNTLADLIQRDIKYLVALHLRNTPDEVSVVCPAKALEALNCGKPYSLAAFDVEHVVCVFRYFAGWCDKIQGDTIPVDGNFFCYTRQEPIGVCGQIIPWNFPLVLLAWKWSAALAAGCTVVLKPAEDTPLTALYVAALTKEAGFPPGVINVVPGYGETAGKAIASHPTIQKVAFTGSFEVGQKVMAEAAKSNLKKVTLELGGKSPLIIFNDADLDVAVQISRDAIMAYQGQVCCAGSRTFVQEDIYDEFVKRAVKAVETRVIEDVMTTTCEHGPQINEKQFKKVLAYIETGKKEGAKLEIGGSRHGDKGYFVKPTIFSGVKEEMVIAKEEIFGPVQCILKFKTMEEAIALANSTSYGLAAGCVTDNINTALTVANSLQGGSVWINCWDPCSPQAPFGGFKQSGFGKELGQEALKAYTQTKTVVIKIPQKTS